MRRVDEILRKVYELSEKAKNGKLFSEDASEDEIIKTISLFSKTPYVMLAEGCRRISRKRIGGEIPKHRLPLRPLHPQRPPRGRGDNTGGLHEGLPPSE